MTPNMDHLFHLQTNRAFYDAYRSASVSILDSRFLCALGRAFGLPLSFQYLLPGIDLVRMYLYHMSHAARETVFFFGGMGETAERAQTRVNQFLGRDLVVDALSPPNPFPCGSHENEKVLERIALSGASVVVVGLGAPKQEIWIHHVMQRLPSVRLWFAAGGTLDFFAGNKQRAPKWLRTLCLEWAFRLLHEGGALWTRYLGRDLQVVPLLIRQALGAYRNPWETT